MKKRNLILSSFLIILFFFTFFNLYSAETHKFIFGKAEIIDGDTIRIKEKKNKTFWY